MSTADHIRNGALAGIGLYLMIAIPLLTLSLGYQRAQAPTVAVASAASTERLGQLLAFLLHG